MGSLREEVLSTPVTVGSHQIYWGSPKPYLLIWCFDHFSSGRAMFESRTRWGLWLLLNRDLGFLMLEQWVCDIWQYRTHLNRITRVESGCLIMSRPWRGRSQCWAGNWGASTFDPRFQRWAKNWQIDRNRVSNAIRRLPMGRSSDEFKAEILMPGT